MHWEIALTLRPGTRLKTRGPGKFNGTEEPLLVLGERRHSATHDMQFIYPMREANPHSFTEIRSYLVWHGVDYSWYKNIRQPTDVLRTPGPPQFLRGLLPRVGFRRGARCRFQGSAGEENMELRRRRRRAHLDGSADGS